MSRETDGFTPGEVAEPQGDGGSEVAFEPFIGPKGSL